MAEVDWAILCDHAFLDIGRKPCLIGTFNRIYARAVPAQHLQFSLVLRFTGSPEELVKFKAEIIRPPTAGGAAMGAINGEVKIGEAGAAEFITSIAGLPLPDYGPYAFNIIIQGEDPGDDKLAKVLTFSVDRMPRQPTEGKAPPPAG